MSTACTWYAVPVTYIGPATSSNHDNSIDAVLLFTKVKKSKAAAEEEEEEDEEDYDEYAAFVILCMLLYFK